MAKSKTMYKCSNCGATFAKWAGQCSSCGSWNTLEDYVEPVGGSAVIAAKNQNRTVKAYQLKDIQTQTSHRIITGISEFDRVVGGGLVDDSMTILAGVPGVGKSTVLLALANKMLTLGKTVVYASGEESASQIKSRADRLKLKNIDDLYILDTTCMNDVLALIVQVHADFVILDSINTFVLNEYLPSRAGYLDRW